jgi:hypothetical protein
VADQPVEAQRESGAPFRVPTVPAHPGSNGAAPPADYPEWLARQRPHPKVVIKADLLPAVSVLAFVSLLGMGVGWIWSRLAPPQRAWILPDGGRAPLPVESYHRADDLVLFTLLCLAAGVFTGVGIWLLRQRRGPVIMIASVLGSAVAGWLAMQVGVSWAVGRFPVTGTPNVGDVVSEAPRLESVWGILAWPLATALAYGVLAAWNGMDDLGRRLS